MGKIRKTGGGYYDCDTKKYEEKMREKALDSIDKKAGDDTGLWVELWCALDNIFSKEQPSVNQLKAELKDVLKDKKK